MQDAARSPRIGHFYCRSLATCWPAAELPLGPSATGRQEGPTAQSAPLDPSASDRSGRLDCASFAAPLHGHLLSGWALTSSPRRERRTDDGGHLLFRCWLARQQVSGGTDNLIAGRRFASGRRKLQVAVRRHFRPSPGQGKGSAAAPTTTISATGCRADNCITGARPPVRGPAIAVASRARSARPSRAKVSPSLSSSARPLAPSRRSGRNKSLALLSDNGRQQVASRPPVESNE